MLFAINSKKNKKIKIPVDKLKFSMYTNLVNIKRGDLNENNTRSGLCFKNHLYSS